jgi:hypothetical protein
MNLQGQVGPQVLSDGTLANVRIDKQGSSNVSELHGRFYEQTYRGNIFSGGMQITSISNATFTTADALNSTLATAATSTPIIGLWNPLTSGVNAEILQATLNLAITVLTATPPGPLVWCVYLGQSALISTALNPINRKTFASPGGALCRNLAGVALTGLNNIGQFLAASAFGTPLMDISETQTAAGFLTSTGTTVENIDGSIVVPPGGILGLFGSVTPIAISAAGSLLWGEVAV